MKPANPNPCNAKKADGTECQGAAVAGTEFCFFHSPDHAGDRQKAQSRGGQANRMTTLPPETPDVKVADAADVVNLLCQTINQVRRGEIDPRVANAVGYLSNLILAATGHRELEGRIAELESLVRYRSLADSNVTGRQP